MYPIKRKPKDSNSCTRYYISKRYISLSQLVFGKISEEFTVVISSNNENFMR